MIMCVQCALEAFVRGSSAADVAKASQRDESPEEHMRVYHPDPVATHARRQELERLASVRIVRENQWRQEHDTYESN